jgi:hypothetical protein
VGGPPGVGIFWSAFVGSGCRVVSLASTFVALHSLCSSGVRAVVRHRWRRRFRGGSLSSGSGSCLPGGHVTTPVCPAVSFSAAHGFAKSNAPNRFKRRETSTVFPPSPIQRRRNNSTPDCNFTAASLRDSNAHDDSTRHCNFNASPLREWSRAAAHRTRTARSMRSE